VTWPIPNAPTVDQLRSTARSVLTETSDADRPYLDDALVGRLADGLADISQSTTPDYRAAGITQDQVQAATVCDMMITAVLLITRVRPVHNASEDLLSRFSGRVSILIAAINGFRLDIQPAGDEWRLETAFVDTLDAPLNLLRLYLLGRLSCECGTDVVLAPAAGAAINAYVGVPITGGTTIETQSVRMMSDGVAHLVIDAVAHHTDCAVVWQPVVCNCNPTHPATDVCAKDVDALVRSDLVVIVTTRPATGLGVVLNQATVAGAAIAVLCPAGCEISPMIAGHAGDIELISFDHWPAATLQLRDYLRRRMHDVVAHRDRRLARGRRWATTLRELQTHVPLSDQLVGLSQQWSTSLVAQALRSVDHLATAPADLVAELMAVADSRRRLALPAPVSGRS
jgi:hypothetical protein